MPLGYVEASRIESKSLVEEYMLMANILVAEFIKPFCGDKTLLRAHNDIDDEKKEELYEFFDKVDMSGKLDLTNSTTLSHSMDALRNSTDEKGQKMFQVALRKFFWHLTAAKYVTINENMDQPGKYSHYGLNFPLYTHFTSPIRRYADLLVHRLTTLCIQYGPKTAEVIENMDYSKYAEMCSEKSLNAKRAS
jgi:exoribonuclease R